MGYPEESEYHAILDRTTGADDVDIGHVTNGEEIRQLRSTVRAVAEPEAARTFAIRLVVATQPDSELAPASVSECASLGSSPRGVQGLILAGKVQALLDDRFAVSADDIRAVALPVLRHRILLNFRAQANNVSADELVEDVLKSVQPPHAIAA